jgi:hypothetical protein
MTPFSFWARIAWSALHLLVVALVCLHETAWLMAKQLTIAPPVSPHIWKNFEGGSATLLGTDLPPGNVFRQVLNTYTNLSGIEVGYGYFAPNVPETHALIFELRYEDGHVEYEPPLVSSHEGELRLTSLVEQIGRTKYDRWRNELIQRLAHSTWQRHPAAISIRGFFGSVTPSTLADYKAGKKERIFSCQYIYDFTSAPPSEETPRKQ